MIRTNVCLLVLLASSTAAAWMRVPPAPSGVGEETAAYAAQGVSLAQATRIALGRFPGRVVRAETINRGGRTVHAVRILGADGRVRTVLVDAQSGSIL